MSAIELLSGTEILEVLVISIYDDGMLRSFQIMTPMLKHRNNSQQFLIVDVVVTLCSSELARPDCDRVDFIWATRIASQGGWDGKTIAQIVCSEKFV